MVQVCKVCMCAWRKGQVDLTSDQQPGKRLPTPTAQLAAELRGEDVRAVEAAIVSVREAYARGDRTAIAEALITQAGLLEALGAKLLALAGAEPGRLDVVQTYANLGLR